MLCCVSLLSKVSTCQADSLSRRDGRVHLSSLDSYRKSREEQRLVQFLMAWRDEFEPLRGSILHRSPLPTVADAVSELIAEETRSSISYVPLYTDAVCLCC